MTLLSALIVEADSSFFLAMGMSVKKVGQKKRIRWSPEETAARKQMRADMFLAQDGKCFWCGEQMRLTSKFMNNPSFDTCTIEHLIDWGRIAREDAPVVGACNLCNQIHARLYKDRNVRRNPAPGLLSAW